MPSVKYIHAAQLKMVDIRGGDEFKLEGSGFSEVTEVYFVDSASKKIQARSFKVIDDSNITGAFPQFTAKGIAQVYVSPGGNPDKKSSPNADGEYANEVVVVSPSVAAPAPILSAGSSWGDEPQSFSDLLKDPNKWK